MRARAIRRVAVWTAVGTAAAAASYAAYVGGAWLRYGRAAAPHAEEYDPLLDRFMPVYEVAERHTVRVNAPAAVTFHTATELDLQQSRIVHAIFRTRELVLGSSSSDRPVRRGLIDETRSIGWGVLAEVPDREIVMGAVTQPWLADVTFRPLVPDAFAAFNEPGFVKIVWTLRADPIGPSTTQFRTETRVVTTDAAARARFRWYWARFSPGIVLIRRMALGVLKTEAERRAAPTPAS